MALRLPKDALAGNNSSLFFLNSANETINITNKTNYAGFRHEKSTAIPILNPFDVVMWDTGIGSYDPPDSSLDGAFWTSANAGSGTTGETDLYAYGDATDRFGTNSSEIATNNLPAVGSMTKLKFRCILHSEISPLPDSYARLVIFGVTAMDLTDAVATDDSIWRVEKRLSGNWDIYNDDVLVAAGTDFAPMDNIIYTIARYDGIGAPGPTQCYGRIYNIQYGDELYLLAQSPIATYKISMTKL